MLPEGFWGSPKEEAKEKSPNVVYMMVTDPIASGNRFIKIGWSSNVWSRIAQVQTCCPLIIEQCAFVRVPFALASRIERGLHKALRAYSTHGEWFVADMDDSGTKEDFNAAFKRVFDGMLGEGFWRWELVI